MTAPLGIDASHYTLLDFERPPSASITKASGFGTATLHEAFGKRGALSAQIKAITPGLELCGPAVTVHSPGGDNLWIHRAIYAARPGDVLVVSCSGQYEFGYWGEIMAAAAVARGIAGLIIDACVRDSALLQQAKFPVFARGCCIRGTGKDFGAQGWINHPILLEDVVVRPGDLMAADADGVVAIARGQLELVLTNSQKREAEEAEIVRALQQGASTLDLYGWNRHAD